MNTKKTHTLTAEELRYKLAPIQEAKGYFFNNDTQMTLDLLEQLLATKDSYGYMACPCRLANGIYEKDRDIFCPCVYRAADVEKYGACFCGLYVSKEWNEGILDRNVIVPDSRPPSNILR